MRVLILLAVTLAAIGPHQASGQQSTTTVMEAFTSYFRQRFELDETEKRQLVIDPRPLEMGTLHAQVGTDTKVHDTLLRLSPSARGVRTTTLADADRCRERLHTCSDFKGILLSLSGLSQRGDSATLTFILRSVIEPTPQDAIRASRGLPVFGLEQKSGVMHLRQTNQGWQVVRVLMAST